MSWNTVDDLAVHRTTGAHNLREHRVAKRAQAEKRNEATPPERRRSWRRITPIGESVAVTGVQSGAPRSSSRRGGRRHTRKSDGASQANAQQG